MNKFIWPILYFCFVLLLLTFFMLFFTFPEEKTLLTSFGVFLFSFLLFIGYCKREKIRTHALHPLFLKRWGGFITEGFLFFCIIALVQYLAYKNPLSFDSTATKKNSLSEVSRNIAQALPSDVKMEVFVTKNERDKYEDFLNLYRVENSKIDIEYIDIDLNAPLAKKYNVTQNGVIFIVHREKRFRVLSPSELEVSRNMKKILREEKDIIYYITGHGELNLHDEQRTGGSFLKGIMLNSSIEIRFLDLKTEDFPSDAKVVLLWGPREGFLKSETEKILSFLERPESRMLMAFDPDFNAHKLQSFYDAFAPLYGLKMVNSLVVDFKSQIQGYDGTVPLVREFNKDHFITRNFQGQVFFPYALMLQIENSADWTPLFESSSYPYSWGEMNFGEVVLKEIVYDEARDIKGPIVMGAAYKDKMVVFGNSTFVENSYGNFSEHFYLFNKALTWCLDDDFSLGQDVIDGSTDVKVISAPLMGFYFYFSFVFGPLLFFFVALWIFLRKKRYSLNE